jgi:hypothetical protein
LFEPRDERVRFPEPAGRQVRDIDDLEVLVRAFEFVKDCGRLVLRTVVDGDNLKSWIILREECREGSGELFRFIPRGKNHRDERRIAGGQWRSVGKQWQTSHSHAGPDTLNNPEGCDQAENSNPENVQNRISREAEFSLRRRSPNTIC